MIEAELSTATARERKASPDGCDRIPDTPCTEPVSYQVDYYCPGCLNAAYSRMCAEHTVEIRLKSTYCCFCEGVLEVTKVSQLGVL